MLKKLLNKALPEPKSKRSSTYPFAELGNTSISRSADDSPAFVFGVGRSGTHFLAECFGLSKDIHAYHLDEVGNSVADSFMMYAKWYKLPIDWAGFIASRSFLIDECRKEGKKYLESNPYLALSARELYEAYPNAKFIVSWRDPRKVVMSHYNKGWYENYDPSLQEYGRAPSYQYGVKNPNHFFGRIFPFEKDDFSAWKQLTQVGKIAWMWQTINNHIKNELALIPEKQKKVIRIEEFDHEAYLETVAFMGLSDHADEQPFLDLVKRKPGKTKKARHTGWGKQEEMDFQDQVAKFVGFEGE